MAVSLVRVMAPTAEAAPAVVMPGAAAGEPSSWLVGRDQELAALLALLDPRPQGPAGVVLTGMAGVGKTALACQAARIAVGRGWFPGGAVIVDLRGPDPNPVTPKWVYDSLLRALDPELLGTRRPGDPRLGADPAAAAELARLCGSSAVSVTDHRRADG